MMIVYEVDRWTSLEIQRFPRDKAKFEDIGNGGHQCLGLE